MSTKQRPLTAIRDLSNTYISSFDASKVIRGFQQSTDVNMPRVSISRTLIEGEQQTPITITLIGEQASALVEFVTNIIEKLSSHTDFSMQPERVTIDIIYEALARYVCSVNHNQADARSKFVNDIKQKLCGKPLPFRFLVPVKNLSVTGEVRFDDTCILPPAYLAQSVQASKPLLQCFEPSHNYLTDDTTVNCAFVDVRVDARSVIEAVDKAKRAATELYLLLRFCLVLSKVYSANRYTDLSQYIDTMILPLVQLGESDLDIRSIRLPLMLSNREPVVSLSQDDCDFPIVKAGLLSRSLSKKSAKSYASDVYQAILWASRSHDETDSNTRLIFLVAALEAVVPTESKSEIAFRVSILSALLLKKAGRDPSDTAARIRRAYELRSRVVHGGNVTVPHVIVDQLSHIVEDIIKLQLETEDVEILLRSKAEDYLRMLHARLWDVS